VNEVSGSTSRVDLHSYLRTRDSGFAHALFAPSDGRLLDVGSGGGEDLLSLEKEGWSVVGVDPRRRRPSVRFVIAIGESLPFREGSFTAATCILVLPHVSSPVSIVREVCRVLVPGGRAAFVVFSRSPLNLRIAVTSHRFSGSSKSFTARLYSTRGMLRLVRSGGFQNVRSWRLDYLPWMTGWMPPAFRVRLLHALDWTERRLSDGPLGFLGRKIVALGVKG